MARQRLRQRRRDLNLSQEELAQACGIATTTYGEYERGEIQEPRIGEQRRRLAKGLQIELKDLDWYMNGAVEPDLTPGWWSNYSTLEQSATSFHTYQPVVVPGVLQTGEYATALLGDARLARQRLQRQSMVTRDVEPVGFVAVLDESVLRRPVGGPDVLAAQLAHLAELAERPNVELLIQPFDAPVQATPWGAFVLLGFPWEGGLVYLEHQGGSRTLDSMHELDAHREAFSLLRGSALPLIDSLNIITRQLKELTP